jgi:RNA polymerase sigma factor (sigma-70 family)
VSVQRARVYCFPGLPYPCEVRHGRDPLANPEPLIKSVYAFVAYRIGAGHDADDVTGEVFERALRYRKGYDPAKGAPLAWLVGIARRVLADRALSGVETAADVPETQAPGELEHDSVERLTLAAALTQLSDKDRELLAMRYGADMKAAQIAQVLEQSTNSVEVALHRALRRLREVMEAAAPEDQSASGGARAVH